MTTAPYVPPIHEPCTLERALEEAGVLLASRPAAGSAAERRVDALIERIASYQLDQPQAVTPAAPSAELDRRIREAAKHLARRNGKEHWAPMVGGDLHPHDEPPAAA